MNDGQPTSVILTHKWICF